MSDYKQTSYAAGIITSRYSDMLKRLGDDYEDEMVVVSLMNTTICALITMTPLSLKPLRECLRTTCVQQTTVRGY